MSFSDDLRKAARASAEASAEALDSEEGPLSRALRGRPRVAEEEKHRTIGISLSPNAATMLRAVANAVGIPQGQLVTELVEKFAIGEAGRSPSHTAGGYATAEQRHLALELTKAVLFEASRSNESPKTRAELAVTLYEEVLREIGLRAIKG